MMQAIIMDANGNEVSGCLMLFKYHILKSEVDDK